MSFERGAWILLRFLAETLKAMTTKTHAWSRLCGCAVLIVLTWLTRADTAEFRELNTDRDAFTPATTTAKMGTVLTEASYVWIDNSGAPATNSFPELLVRIATRERFEWRLGFNYEQGSSGAVVSAVEVGEPMLSAQGGSEANILYGCKVRLTDGDGLIPRSAAIIEAFTPLAGDVWGTEPAATYAFGWELPDQWRLDAAARYASADSEEGRFTRWSPSAVLRIPLTERMEVHAEWFGTWSEGLANESVQQYVGPGGHFMLSPRLELGCRMGWGLSSDAAGYYVDTGIGWTF